MWAIFLVILTDFLNIDQMIFGEMDYEVVWTDFEIKLKLFKFGRELTPIIFCWEGFILGFLLYKPLDVEG